MRLRPSPQEGLYCGTADLTGSLEPWRSRNNCVLLCQGKDTEELHGCLVTPGDRVTYAAEATGMGVLAGSREAWTSAVKTSKLTSVQYLV